MKGCKQDDKNTIYLPRQGFPFFLNSLILGIFRDGKKHITTYLQLLIMSRYGIDVPL